MSFNGNQNNGRLGPSHSTTGSMGQTPFMFGGSYGPSGNNSCTSFSFGNQSVRDCMYWPTSLPTDNNNQRSNYTNYYSRGGGQNYNCGPQQARQQQPAASPAISYPQPKAFIQMPGMGGGEAKLQPLQIPCHLGPSGSPMQSLSTPEPLTIKVRAPEGAGFDGQPIKFQIDPSQYMGMASMKTYPGGRR